MKNIEKGSKAEEILKHLSQTNKRVILESIVNTGQESCIVIYLTKYSDAADATAERRVCLFRKEVRMVGGKKTLTTICPWDMILQIRDAVPEVHTMFNFV